jgi:hypothetical protein
LFCGTVEAANLVLNPGFKVSARTPQNWTITGPVSTMVPIASINSHVQYSGLLGLKMESTNTNCHGRAVQIVEIIGGQTYLITARFKTERVKTINKSVLIRIKWFKDNDLLGYNYIYDIIVGSDGWFLASNKGPTSSLPNAFPDVTIVLDHPNSFVIKSKKKGNP